METEAKAEIGERANALPESATQAFWACVAYMPPDALAALIDYWCDEQRTLPLAQMALDEGTSNCGAMQLAEYVASRERRSSQVLSDWHRAGLVIEAIVFYPQDATNEVHEQIDLAANQISRLIRR